MSTALRPAVIVIILTLLAVLAVWLAGDDRPGPRPTSNSSSEPQGFRDTTVHPIGEGASAGSAEDSPPVSTLALSGQVLERSGRVGGPGVVVECRSERGRFRTATAVLRPDGCWNMDLVAADAGTPRFPSDVLLIQARSDGENLASSVLTYATREGNAPPFFLLVLRGMTRLRGRVVDTRGNPMPGIQVTVTSHPITKSIRAFWEDGDASRHSADVRTDKEGVFVTRVRSGSGGSVVACSKTGFATESTIYERSTQGGIDVGDITLPQQPDVRWTITFVDPNGAPVKDAVLKFGPPERDHSRAQLSCSEDCGGNMVNETGAIELLLPCRETAFIVGVSAPRSVVRALSLDVSSPGHRSAIVTLDTRPHFFVRLSGPGKEAIAAVEAELTVRERGPGGTFGLPSTVLDLATGASVKASEGKGFVRPANLLRSQEGCQASRQADGAYRVDVCALGRYELSLVLPDGTKLRKEVDLARELEGSTIDLAIPDIRWVRFDCRKLERWSDLQGSFASIISYAAWVSGREAERVWILGSLSGGSLTDLGLWVERGCRQVSFGFVDRKRDGRVPYGIRDVEIPAEDGSGSTTIEVPVPRKVPGPMGCAKIRVVRRGAAFAQAGIPVDIRRNEDRRVFGTFRTDCRGELRVFLTPGAYSVKIGSHAYLDPERSSSKVLTVSGPGETVDCHLEYLQ